MAPLPMDGLDRIGGMDGCRIYIGAHPHSGHTFPPLDLYSGALQHALLPHVKIYSKRLTLYTPCVTMVYMLGRKGLEMDAPHRRQVA